MLSTQASRPSLAPQPADITELRRAFGAFLTGVTVVTTRDDQGRPRGMTANSFTSVSLDPPLVLVCIGKSASSAEAFQTSNHFAVNLLDATQTEVSTRFASKAADKFDSMSHSYIHTGAPVLNDCLAWFDCSIYDRVNAGDHTILIGRVEAFNATAAPPLGFCRGQYARIESNATDHGVKQ